jgi:hypothetical protein
VARTAHVLIVGPPGPDTGHLPRIFREQGRNAIEANEVPGLVQSVGVDGKPREVNEEERIRREPLLRRWDEERLRHLLDENEELYLFGHSPNLFDLAGLFDRCYFLQPTRERFANALRDTGRENYAGLPHSPPERVSDELLGDVERAKKANFRILDASEDGLELFRLICRPGVTKRRP